MQTEHLRVLISKQELERSILIRLQSTRMAKDATKCEVLARRKCLQHAPLFKFSFVHGRSATPRALQSTFSTLPLIWLGRRTTSFAVAGAPLLAPSPLLGPEAKRHP